MSWKRKQIDKLKKSNNKEDRIRLAELKRKQKEDLS